MLIRRELPGDAEAIDAIHRAAFEGEAPGAEPVEVRLVRALREDRGWIPGLSLVAEEDGAVIGHVVVSEGAIGNTPVGGLGPIGVLPRHQGRRVGHALMHGVLAAADALDYPAVVLLGHVDFYPRFGFVPAASLGIEAPDPHWGEHFQARPLAAHRPGLSGVFRYAAPFDDV